MGIGQLVELNELPDTNRFLVGVLYDDIRGSQKRGDTIRYIAIFDILAPGRATSARRESVRGIRLAETQYIWARAVNDVHLSALSQ